MKDQVFANDDHITLKKIKEKATNMKRAWKDAKAMQGRSGWGLKSEDNEPSINDRLEQKCGFFWRLEEILWYATVVVYTESIATSFNVPPQRAPKRASQAISQATPQAASGLPSQPASFESQPTYESQAGSCSEAEELFDWSASPTP